jgi:hypothetical protein
MPINKKLHPEYRHLIEPDKQSCGFYDSQDCAESIRELLTTAHIECSIVEVPVIETIVDHETGKRGEPTIEQRYMVIIPRAVSREHVWELQLKDFRERLRQGGIKAV